jgi:hypothetical protein
MSTSTDTGGREPNSGLFVDVLRQISTIFGTQFTEVLQIHRRLEVLTDETNVVGRQNLLEAFSHLSILLARAPDLNRDEQLQQIAFLSDHLRRTMMEGFELEVYVALADVWGEKSSIGRKYEARAAPLIKRGKLLGHVTPEEVRRRRDDIIDRVTIARDAKVADGGWEVWKAAAYDLDAALTALRTLKREMGAAVDAAEGSIVARRRWILGIVLGAVLGLAGRYGLQLLS